MSTHRVAIVGCGNVSRMHFHGYLDHPERVEVVAAVDPSAERRRYVEETFGVSDTYTSTSELIDNTDFDVASVCTPTHVRLDAVRELAEAGKHLHVEKPMADGIEQALEIVTVASEAGIALAVDQNFRDHYSFGIAREIIHSGRIGRIMAIDHRDLVFREVTGWRAESTHHALSVMGVHWFDGFRYLLDQEADWLVATTSRSPSLTAAGETDASVHLRFGDVGVNYIQSFSSRVERVETIVIGEQGTLALGYDQLQVADAEGVETFENPCGRRKQESAYRSLERLLDAIDSHTEPGNSGADNLKTLALLEAAYRSADSRDIVRLTNGML